MLKKFLYILLDRFTTSPTRKGRERPASASTNPALHKASDAAADPTGHEDDGRPPDAVYPMF